jgi:hypothetical protein
MVRDRAATDALSQLAINCRVVNAANAIAAEVPIIDEPLLHIDHMHRTCDFEALITFESIIIRYPALAVNDSKTSARSE